MRKAVFSAASITCLLALSACGSEPASEGSAEPMAQEEARLTLADLTGDAAAGEAVYAKCRVCHLIEPGKNGVGPSLHGVIGRNAGAVEGFAYSEANANADIVWTPDVMFDYLEAPRDYLPGSRMAFPGIRDAQERANLIAYLETQG